MDQRTDSASLEEQIAALRATPEGRAALLANARPFDVDAWMRTVPPATPGEIAETDAFLAEIRADRDADLARETAEIPVP